MIIKKSRSATDKEGRYIIPTAAIYVYTALLILQNFIRIFDNIF